MKKTLFIILSCVILFSCEKNKVGESTSRFMIVHAAANVPDMEFYIDDKPIILLPLKFTSNTYYRDILSGIRNFKVKISGDLKIDTNMNFEKDDVRSVFFYDKPSQLKMKVVDDSLVGPPANFCRARFFQMVPDATKLDLFDNANAITRIGNTNLGDNSEWVNILAGTYNFSLINTTGQDLVYKNWRPDTLLPGRNYTIIANGFRNTMTNDTIGIWILSNGDF